MAAAPKMCATKDVPPCGAACRIVTSCSWRVHISSHSPYEYAYMHIHAELDWPRCFAIPLLPTTLNYFCVNSWGGKLKNICELSAAKGNESRNCTRSTCHKPYAMCTAVKCAVKVILKKWNCLNKKTILYNENIFGFLLKNRKFQYRTNAKQLQFK